VANGLLVVAALLRLAGGPLQTSEALYMPAVAAAALCGGFAAGCATAFCAAILDVTMAALWSGALDVAKRPWLVLGSGLLLSVIGGIAQRLLTLRTSEALVANALLRFGRSVGDPTQLPILQRAVVDSGPPLIECDYGAVFVWNDELRQFDLAAQSTGSEQRGFRYFAGGSVARWQRMLSAAGPQPMDAAGLAELPLRDARGRPLLRRAVWVPMRRWGRCIGGVLFGSTRSAMPFTGWEVRIAEGVAGHVAVAMEGAEAFEALQSRADEIRRLLQLAQELNAQLDLAELRRRIAEHAAALGRSQVATVGLWEEGALVFDGCWMGREWRPVARREPDAGALLPVGNGVVTGLALAIPGSDGKHLGAVELYGRPASAPFTADDVRLLSGLVNVAAVAIQNARFYERLVRQNEQLRALEQLRDDLTHMIVHDLRTPLAGIMTALQTMEAGIVGDLPEEAAAISQIALDNAAELLGMVNDLLNVGRLESGQMRLERRSTAADALVSRATRQVERLCREKQLALEVAVAEGVPPVHVDEDMATRILVNLLGNAIKFTPTGGRITVTVRAGDDHVGHVAFQVADTGRGIPRRLHERIFEKFAQVDDDESPGEVVDGAAASRRGRRVYSTGLGLTFCKMAAEAHGGRIWVESETGRGSAFTFTLPAVDLPLPSRPAALAADSGSTVPVP
jgi:signal transduction histidine kinase